jgi:hypothetical protein
MHFSTVEIHYILRRDYFLQNLRISSAENFKVKPFFTLWLRYWQLLLSLTKHVLSLLDKTSSLIQFFLESSPCLYDVICHCPRVGGEGGALFPSVM